MPELPDKMTGKDLVVQEEYEAGIERRIMKSMDRVDRRDRRGDIVSSVASKKYRDGWMRIWGKK